MNLESALSFYANPKRHCVIQLRCCAFRIDVKNLMILGNKSKCRSKSTRLNKWSGNPSIHWFIDIGLACASDIIDSDRSWWTWMTFSLPPPAARRPLHIHSPLTLVRLNSTKISTTSRFPLNFLKKLIGRAVGGDVVSSSIYPSY